MNIDRLKKQLKIDEGLRNKPYQDSKGIWTIGIGRNLNKGLSHDEILYLFGNDIQSAIHDCYKFFKDFEQHDDVRQEIVINMMFNMGLSIFSEFKKFKKAFDDMEYSIAADEMVDSLWHTDVGRRAIKLERAMRLGQFEKLKNSVK